MNPASRQQSISAVSPNPTLQLSTSAWSQSIFNIKKECDNVNSSLNKFVDTFNKRGNLHLIKISKDYIKPIYDHVNGWVSNEDERLLRENKFLVNMPNPSRTTSFELVERTDITKFNEALKGIKEKQGDGIELTALDIAVEKFYYHQIILPQVMHKRSEVAQAWAQERSKYNPNKNGEYPIRDIEGNRIRITQIESKDSKGIYSADMVKPFISSKKTNDERADLYSKLICREITESDLKSPHEKSLIGQSMVVANEAIPKGTCLGVYGGTLIRGEDKIHFTEGGYTYTIGVPIGITPRDQISEIIDGDTILSRLNSTFDYDISGKPYRQSLDGYNVEPVKFTITLEDGSKIGMITLFSKENINKGEELRWDYGYDKNFIDKIIIKSAHANV